MKRNCLILYSFLFNFLISLGVSAVAAESVPDMSGFWMVDFSASPQQVLMDKLPEAAIYINDGGSGELGEGEFSGLTLTERALSEIDNYDFEAEWSVANTCSPPSVAFYMQAPFPMEIFQGEDLIIFKMEYFDMVRVIFMSDRQALDNMPHSKNGYSLGHWEADELVVETTHITPGTFMNNGFSHSEDLLFVERFKISDDGNSLWSTELSYDPAVFNGEASRFVGWRKVENEHVYPYECDPSFGR